MKLTEKEKAAIRNRTSDIMDIKIPNPAVDSIVSDLIECRSDLASKAIIRVIECDQSASPEFYKKVVTLAGLPIDYELLFNVSIDDLYGDSEFLNAIIAACDSMLSLKDHYLQYRTGRLPLPSGLSPGLARLLEAFSSCAASELLELKVSPLEIIEKIARRLAFAVEDANLEISLIEAARTDSTGAALDLLSALALCNTDLEASLELIKKHVTVDDVQN